MSRGHLQLSFLNSERTLRYKDFLFDDNDFGYNDDDVMRMKSTMTAAKTTKSKTTTGKTTTL